MGASIWQYLWCLDKVTKIDAEGRGVVLGGKPVNLADFGKLHASSISESLKKLKKEGYIEMTRTMYGIIIKVPKMKKRFSQNTKTGYREKAKSRIRKTPNPNSENTKSRSENTKSNKTITVDNSSKTLGATAPTPKEKSLMFFEGVEKLKKKESVEWLQDMLRTIVEKNNIRKEALWDEIQKFANYWTELNSTGTKQRWQMERTFEIDRRLITWFTKAKIINTNSPPQKYEVGRA